MELRTRTITTPTGTAPVKSIGSGKRLSKKFNLITSKKGLQCQAPWNPSLLPQELLEMIFWYIPINDDSLQKKERNIRLVCHSWNKAASNVFQKFYPNEKSDRYISKNVLKTSDLFLNSSTPQMLLQSLQIKDASDLRLHPRFPPFPGTSIKPSRKEKNNLRPFYKSFGHLVKKLSFAKEYMNTIEINLALLRILLLEWFSSVKEIQFFHVYYEEDSKIKNFTFPPASLKFEKFSWLSKSEDDFDEKSNLNQVPMILPILKGIKTLKHLKICLQGDYALPLEFFTKLRNEPKIIRHLEELHLFLDSARTINELVPPVPGDLYPVIQERIKDTPENLSRSFNIFADMEFGSRIKVLSLSGHHLCLNVKDVARLLIKVEDTLQVLNIFLRTYEDDEDIYESRGTRRPIIPSFNHLQAFPKTPNLVKLKNLHYLIHPDLPVNTIRMLGSFPNLEYLHLGFLKMHDPDDHLFLDNQTWECRNESLDMSTEELESLLSYFCDARDKRYKKFYSFEKVRSLNIHGVFKSKEIVQTVCNLFPNLTKLEVKFTSEDGNENPRKKFKSLIGLDILAIQMPNLKTLCLAINFQHWKRSITKLDFKDLLHFTNLSHLKIIVETEGLFHEVDLYFPSRLWRTIARIPKLEIFTIQSNLIHIPKENLIVMKKNLCKRNITIRLPEYMKEIRELELDENRIILPWGEVIVVNSRFG